MPTHSLTRLFLYLLTHLGMSLVTLGDAKKTESLLADAGLVIFLGLSHSLSHLLTHSLTYSLTYLLTHLLTYSLKGPCQQSHYTDLKSFGDKLNAPVIALNAPFSYKYDIGGGALTHSLDYSLTHSLTYLLTYLLTT